MAWFFLTIVAVLFVVAETVIEKRMLARVGSVDFAAAFALGNALMLVPLLFMADVSHLDPFILFLIFLSAVPSAGASFLVFKTIKHNQLSEAAPILALLPLVVAMLAFVLLGEKMTLSQYAGMFLMAGGMVFLEMKNMKIRDGIFRQGRGRYVLYIVLYLFVAAISSIFDRLLLSGYRINALTYLMFIQFFIVLCYGAYYVTRPKEIISLIANIKSSWRIFFLISLLTVTHRWLYTYAIQIATSIGVVVAVYKLSALLHVFSGKKFFGERDIFRKAVAGVVILGGTILLAIT